MPVTETHIQQVYKWILSHKQPEARSTALRLAENTLLFVFAIYTVMSITELDFGQQTWKPLNCISGYKTILDFEKSNFIFQYLLEHYEKH